jgi:hypothetical protein
MFGEGDPHTPAFSRKSVEGIEWKGVVKHSWREERGIGSKTGNEGCTGRKGGDLARVGYKSYNGL